MAALLRSGSTARLQTPQPHSPRSWWTSLITGQRAHRHGVLHEQQPAPQQHGTCPVTRDAIRTATLGAILSEHGFSIHQINWPVSFPAEPLRGIAVAEGCALPAATLRGTKGGWPWVTPPSAAQEIFARRSLPADIEEMSLADLVPASCATGATLDQLQAIGRLVLAESLTVFRSTQWCLQASDWNCTLCYFPTLERFESLAAANLQLAQQADLWKRMLAGCHEHLDTLLGQMLATAGEETLILLVAMGASAGQVELVISHPADTVIQLPSSANLLDVTPTLLAWFGIPAAQDMEGQIWTGFLPDNPTHDSLPERVETWQHCVHTSVEQVTEPSPDATSAQFETRSCGSTSSRSRLRRPLGDRSPRSGKQVQIGNASESRSVAP